MKPILHQYSEDENGELIHIDNASKEHKYHCVECHEEMIIKAGEKRRKHFAHKGETHCDGESYIHKIWKRRIRETFYRKTSMPITFIAGLPCKSVDSCKIKNYLKQNRCNKLFSLEIDLKQEYDTCEEEKEYKGYKGDLVLTNSQNPEKEPLFIEIYYTHPCEIEKIEAGIKIIEIKVCDDSEKTRYLTEAGEFELRLDQGNPYKTKKIPNTRFYNFNRLPYPKIGRFSITTDEKGILEGHYTRSVISCKEDIKYNGNSQMEIYIADGIYDSQPDYYYESMLAIAAERKIYVRDCRLCITNVLMKASHQHCPYMKNNSPKTAQHCPNLRINFRDIKNLARRLNNVPHEVFPKL